jgi:hypothetical protein
MRSKKPRRLFEVRSQPAQAGPEQQAVAPAFLVRLVGKTQAEHLCRKDVVNPRRD